MGFVNYLKAKLKYLFGIAGIAALLSQLILPALGVKADGPAFNFLPDDQALIRGVNVSRDEAVWKNPINGNAGEIFRGLVYYHNGVVDTTANNTRIKVNLPASTTNGKAVISASISADNASTVTNTVVDGQIIGLNGLHLDLDKDANLEFIPGSVRWFPNSSTSGGPNEAPHTLPFGQTGNEIVSGSGVNIGDIQGCFNFAGFISFDFRTRVNEVQKQLSIEKMVRNVSRGEQSFTNETFAKEGEEVQFEVEPINPGTVDLDNAVLKDDLPLGLQFVPGTFGKSTGGGEFVPLSDSQAAMFFDGGLSIGTLKPHTEERNEFRFKAKVTDPATEQIKTLTNKAIVTAEGLTAFATASVKVEVERANIIKSKSAYNDTKKKPADIVNVGDLVTFTLNAKNTGNASTSLVFEDNVSEVLRFAEIVRVSDGGHLEDGVLKWPSVTIDPGQNVSRNFQVRIKDDDKDKDCFNNFFGNNVQVCVEKKEQKEVVLHLDKFVRDITTNESSFKKEDTAFAGDTLEYLITFSNAGNGEAENVKITDTIPANTQFITGSTVISENGGKEHSVSDCITDGGLIIKVLPGESGSIKFRVKISNGVAAKEVLTNTAFLTHKEQTISATARTTIVTQVVQAKQEQLPKSGATAGLSFFVTMIGGIGALYIKYRKAMAKEEVAIINQLMAA